MNEIENEITSVINKFVEAVKSNNLNKMYSNSQVTWRSNHNKSILKIFKQVEIIKFEILDIKIRNNVFANITAALTDPDTLTVIEFILIKESKPYTPRETGRWGVNPISFLKHTKLRYDGIS